MLIVQYRGLQYKEESVLETYIYKLFMDGVKLHRENIKNVRNAEGLRLSHEDRQQGMAR